MTCNDANGLALVVSSEDDPETTGLYTTLLRTAATLSPGDDAAPTILIETDKRNIIVKEYDGLTMAISQKGNAW